MKNHDNIEHQIELLQLRIKISLAMFFTALVMLTAIPSSVRAQMFAPTTPANLVNVVVDPGVGMNAGTFVGVFGNDPNMAGPSTRVGSPSRFYTNTKNVIVELIFWGNAWSGQWSTAEQLIGRAAFTFTITGSYLSELKQYGVQSVMYNGYVNAGSIPSACGMNPPSSVDVFAIQSFIWCMISNGKVPSNAYSNGTTTLYVVLTPPGVKLSGSNGTTVPAFHFGVPDSAACGSVYASDAVNGNLDLIEFILGPLIALPFNVAQMNCTQADFANTAIVSYSNNGFTNPVDGMTYALSHELVEALTDPIPAVGYSGVTAGSDPTNSEIADICDEANRVSARIFAGALVAPYWSTKQHACVVPVGNAGQLGGGAITSFTDGANAHVAFVGTDNQVHDLVYNAGNWYQEYALPSTPAMGLTNLTSFYSASIGSHIFYVGADWHIHDVYGGDLMALDADTPPYNAPNVQNPLSVVTNPTNRGPWGPISLTGYYDGAVTHVFYIGTDGYLHEMYNNGAQWHTNLWVQPGATELTSYFDGRFQHVFYQDQGGYETAGNHIHEVIYDNWTGRGGWVDTDLMYTTSTWGPMGSLIAQNAPNTALPSTAHNSDLLTSFYDWGVGIGHVLYVGTDNHIHDLWSRTSDNNSPDGPNPIWNTVDASAQSNDFAIPTSLTSFYDPQNAADVLMFTDASSGALHDWWSFYYRGNANWWNGWAYRDYQPTSGSPLGSRAVTSVYNPGNQSESWFYVGWGSDVYQYTNVAVPPTPYTNSNGSWWQTDITAIAQYPSCLYGKTQGLNCTVPKAVP